MHGDYGSLETSAFGEGRLYARLVQDEKDLQVQEFNKANEMS